MICQTKYLNNSKIFEFYHKVRAKYYKNKEINIKKSY